MLYGKQTKTEHLIFILPSDRKERRPTKDRNVQYPQRYQLVKVEGTDDIYDIIPAPGEVSGAGTLINKATLLKDATAALYGYSDPGPIVPDHLFATLSKAALYYSAATPKYQEITVDLSTVQSGDIIQLPVSGVLKNHRVLHIGNPNDTLYDASCNGVWISPEFIQENVSFNSGTSGESGSEVLKDSELMTKMATYLAFYPSDVQAAIKTVKIPYSDADDNVQKLANGLSCQMFPLSAWELGHTNNDYNADKDGAKLDYFTRGNTAAAKNKRICKLNNTATRYWTRTSIINNSNIIQVDSDGSWVVSTAERSRGSRYTFIMDQSFSKTYYVDNEGTLHDEQEYESAGSTTDVQGNPIVIGTQIATGSYVGTGTYGASNPNTLTFSFTPKIWGISYSVDGTDRRPASELEPNTIVWGVNSNGINSDLKTYTYSGNSVSWYSRGNDVYQDNVSGETYYYFAIG